MKKVICSLVLVLTVLSGFSTDITERSLAIADESIYPVVIALIMIVGAITARIISKRRSAKAH